MDQASCAQSKSPWRTWPQDKYAKYEQLSTPASPQIGCPHIRCAGLIRRGLVVICVSTAAHVFREKRLCLPARLLSSSVRRDKSSRLEQDLCGSPSNPTRGQP